MSESFNGRQRSSAVTAPPTAVYCPGLDAEMTKNIDSMVNAGMVIKAGVHAGGGRSLRTLPPHTKLYVICHGNSQLPVFQTKAGSWSAEVLTTLMITDGLSTAHREIEMLVCHAGESVTTKAALTVRLPIYLQFQAAKQGGDEAAMGMLKDKFVKAVEANPAPPAFFSHEDQVLPLCAQFAQALKTAGFGYIRVTGYKCPVAQYYGTPPNGQVHLDLKSKGGSWGVPAVDHPDYKVIWQ